MGDVYSTPTIDELRAGTVGTPAAEAPGPGFFGSIAPGFRRARAAEDWGLNQANYEGRVLAEIRQAAEARGFKLKGRQPASPSPVPGNIASAMDSQIDELLAWVAEERARDPKFMPDYAAIADRNGLRTWALERRREDVAKADAELQGGSGVGAMVGALGAGFLDPTSYIPVGGTAARGLSVARQIATVAGREAVANVGMSLALEPFVQQDAAALGVERDMGDVLSELAMAGFVGGTIGGAAKGLEIGAGALSARVRARRESAGTNADHDVLETAEQSVPSEMRTPDEQAAINVLRRDIEVAEASPFQPNVAGADAHVRALDAAMAEAVKARPSPPPAPRTVTRSALLSGAADPAQFRAPAREQLKARIRQAESGGNDRAVPRDPRTGALLSSASGRYQFTMPTFLSYYKRRYGAKEGNNAIWAKRFDPNIQDVLMNDLVADNGRALREAGQPETAGSLYLLHFAGEKGGLAILRAAPETPIERVLSADAIRANKFLSGKTAGDVIAWADGKMGGEATPRVVAAEGEAPLPELPEIDRTPIAAADFEAKPDWLDWLDEGDSGPLRADLFGTPEDHAAAQVALWRERDAADGFASVIDDPVVRDPAADYDALLKPMAPEPEGRAFGARETGFPNGGYYAVDAGGNILVPKGHVYGAMPKKFGSEAAAIKAAPKMVPLRSIEPGKAAAAPRARSGPVDVMQAIADAGGLLDNEGHDLAKGRGIPKFLLGAGSIIRKDGDARGRGVDAMGEHLWSLGYFGPPDATPRPSEAQVLDLIERATREKIYRPDEAAAAAERALARTAPDEAEARWELNETAREMFDAALDTRAMDHALALRAQGEPVEDAVREALTGAAWRDAEPGVQPFEHPAGPEAEAQMNSIEHDLRMMLDAEGDTPFWIDEAGEERTLADIMAEIDEEADAAQAMRACMAPERNAA